MEMKWNPIIEGDLSGIPINKDLLFAVCDEWSAEPYVISGLVTRSLEGVLEITDGGWEFNAKDVKAWMELPEPYQPGRCDICKHWKLWIDNFGDRWSKCELMEIGTFVPLQKCPLKK